MSADATKQPNEVIPVTLNFRALLPTGETLQPASDVTALLIDGQIDATSDLVQSVAVNPESIVATIKNGDNGKKYKLTFTAVTQSYRFEEEVFLTVKEI